ncbi:MAG: hypothetical protein ACKOWF_07215 [Chloroflexota bacterium]
MTVPAVWTLGGLPAHPLLVHAATVLVVLAALAALALMIWKAAWRRRLVGPLAIACLGLLVLTQLTVMTGEQLAEATGAENEPEIHEHEEAGEMTRNLLALLTLGLGALAIVDRRDAGSTAADVRAAATGDTTDRRSVLSGALRLGTGAVALATLGYDIKAGHSGAWAVWHEELAGGEEGEGGGGEESGESGEAGETGEKPKNAEAGENGEAGESGEAGEATEAPGS